jgi:transposase-like protein
VSHANAALTPRARLRLAQLIVEHGWPVARAAERYDVSWPTAKRWADRYRQSGAAGMTDRSSRPHHCPRRTPRPLVRKIVHLRWKQRLGPVEIGAKLAMPASTVHAVLVRCRHDRHDGKKHGFDHRHETAKVWVMGRVLAVALVLLGHLCRRQSFTHCRRRVVPRAGQSCGPSS